jgi:hypothetical protein
MLSFKNLRKDMITTVLGILLAVGVLVAKFIPESGTSWADVILIEPVALGLMGIDSKKLLKRETDNQ